MVWKYITPLESEDLITEFETMAGCKFPVAYKNCVKKYNEGSPEKTVFGKGRKERVFNHLYSFNKEKSKNRWGLSIWDIYELWRAFDGPLTLHGKENSNLQYYIAVADTCFGDDICIDTRDGHIVWLDHESGGKDEEYIAKSFSEFIRSLRKGIL